jgi:hypothetical protein
MIPWRRHSPATGGYQFLHREATKKEKAMTHFKTLLIAAPVAMGLLAAPAAHAEWHGGGGWHGGGWHGGGWHGGGIPLGAALLGLGAAAVVGGIIASQPPVVAYAPPPAYYPAPGYATPYYAAPAYPGAYYAPQAYYAPPGY